MNRSTLAKIDREMSALGFIQVRIKNTGRPPTIPEIAQRLDVSVATAANYVDALERAKLITREKSVERGIRVVEPFDLII
jgi:DNA-binding MarR family transcriptional regulator